MSNEVVSDYKPFAERLFLFLQDKAPDTFYPFDQLDKEAGTKVREYRQVIYHVRKRLLKERGKVLVSVPTKGYKLLNDVDKVTESESLRRRSHNSVKKSLAILESVDQSKLEGGDKNRFIKETVLAANFSTLHAVGNNVALMDSAIKKIQQADYLRLMLSTN